MATTTFAYKKTPFTKDERRARNLSNANLYYAEKRKDPEWLAQEAKKKREKRQEAVRLNPLTNAGKTNASICLHCCTEFKHPKCKRPKYCSIACKRAAAEAKSIATEGERRNRAYAHKKAKVAKNMSMAVHKVSAVEGVHWCNSMQRWVAKLELKGKKRSWCFENEEDAIAKRKELEIEHAAEIKEAFDIKYRVKFHTEEEKKAGNMARIVKFRKANPGKEKEYVQTSIEKNPLRFAYNQSKKSATQRGIPFTLELSDLTFPDVCACCGVKLVLRGGRKNRATASIDRIDSRLGYIVGNWEWLCLGCNRMKSNYVDAEQFLETANNIYRYMTKHGLGSSKEAA